MDKKSAYHNKGVPAGLIDKLSCPTCSQSLKGSAPLNAELSDDGKFPASIICRNCGKIYPVHNEIIDFVYEGAGGFNLSQYAMELPFIVSIYEKIWRPLITTIQSSYKWEKNRIMELVNLSMGKDVLDIACGPGNYSRPFAKNVKGDNSSGLVVGLDLSWPMLKNARRTLVMKPHPNLAFIHANVTHWPFLPESFDCIHCSGALHLFPDIASVFKSIGASLKPGGIFVGSTYIKKNNPIERLVKEKLGAFMSFHWFTAEELKELAKQAGLTEWRHYIKKSGIIFTVKRA